VIAAAVPTYTEDEYLINNDYRGRELLRFIQEEVEVEGIVTQNKDKKMIGVQKYLSKKTQE
jgi:hypothetical protein